MKENLDERILKNFRENMAISNLKEEFKMKRIMKKQIWMFSIVAVVFVSGSFLTVNAATGGEVINHIKEALMGKVEEKTGIDVKEDSFTVEDYETDEDGNVTSSTYTFEDESGFYYKVEEK